MEGNTGNPIIVSATGSGKSVMIGRFIQRAMTEFTGQRFLMATHVKELIAQNYEKLITFWPDAPAGIYSAGLGKKQPWADVVCGGIQSMYKKADRFGHRDILLIDECHLLSPEDEGMYITFINSLKQINPRLKVVGFTATDWRTKGGSLVGSKGGIFTHVIFKKGIKELVDEGFLAPLISKSSLIQADLTGIKMTAGEFNLKQAEAALDREELTKQAIDEVEKLTTDRKHFLFFCAGVDHSLHVRDELRARGWLADIITCNTPSQERAALLLQFKHSKVKRALVNNAVLTTGTDLPNIDCIVLLRATMSSILYIQMLGRGMRLHHDKQNCLVLDYAGNIARFGAVDLIEAPYSNKNKNEGKVSAPPQRICPNCREPVQISQLECKCGHIFIVGDRPGHENSASNQAIMSHEIKPATYSIDIVTYKSHIGKSGVPCLRVMYYDKFGLIASDFVFFSHSGQPRYNAERWAKDRGVVGNLPKNTEEALAMSENFKQPISMTTIKSGQYQKILSYEFAN